MPKPIPTEIIIDEQGSESHPSWLLIKFSRITSQPGARLFDSEIQHQHYIQMTVSRCTRQRDLNRDWIHARQTLIEVDMSEAQFGAFVSSFGMGDGVPATLNSLMGEMIPGVATRDSRLDKSHEEVRNTASRAMREVKQAHQAVQDAFERGAGKREMRELLRSLQIRVDQVPGNMEYAAKSLSEHVETVTTKMKSDIEAMVLAAQQQGKELDGAELFAIEGVDTATAVE